jgi:hypothetical protein
VKIRPAHLEADTLGPFIAGGGPKWGMAFVLQKHMFCDTLLIQIGL